MSTFDPEDRWEPRASIAPPLTRRERFIYLLRGLRSKLRKQP